MNGVSLFIMTSKGLGVLKSLSEKFGSGFIKLVITGNDINVKEDYAAEIQNYCRQNNINCVDRTDEILIETKFAIAISWRWIIPQSANYKLIVLHDSLLPDKRGFNPLVTALINGDRKIGVSALFSSEKYDTGPIIEQLATDIFYPLKIREAIDIVTKLYIEIVLKLAGKINNGEAIEAVPQDDSKATYSLWRDEKDYYTNWNESSDRIKRFIDAVGYPYSGAKTTVNGEEITITEVTEVDDVIIANRDAGKIIYMEDGCPVVVCGKGLLKICSMFRQGGEQFLLTKFRSRFI